MRIIIEIENICVCREIKLQSFWINNFDWEKEIDYAVYEIINQLFWQFVSSIICMR